MDSPLDLSRLSRRTGAWLRAGGPEVDVVVSSRARLARNLVGFPFVTRLAPEQALEVEQRLRELLVGAQLDGETVWVSMTRAPLLLRLLLRERHLVSRELAPSDQRRSVSPGRAVAFGDSETLSVMVNEEDHARLQSFSRGLDLRGAVDRVVELDRVLEDGAELAWHDELGYLTGCPTNVGTGLRASVMMHLPALGLARKELERVFQAAQRTGLAVRGLYGEGSKAVGDYYQLSNQVTLGRTEDQLVGDLLAFVPEIARFERELRDRLFAERRTPLSDRVSRSLGMLRTARAMATENALVHLSNVRLGVCLGQLESPPLEEIDALTIQIQKAHVQAGQEDSPDPAAGLLEMTQRDRLRASLLRDRIARTAGEN